MSLVANDVDGVLKSLDIIIDWSKDNDQRAGYFAALYRRVTERIKEDVEAGVFDDNERMAKLDVIFANRYLSAFEEWRDGGEVPVCWQQAFKTSHEDRPIVLQHLLLGMNAHINFDLGIAAVEVAPGEELAGLESDFQKINSVLEELVGTIQAELAEVWTGLRWMNRHLGHIETSIINFSMTEARDYAWHVANEVNGTAHEDQRSMIARADNFASDLSRLIRFPGLWLGLVAAIIRLTERGSTRWKIDVLSSPSDSPN